MLGYQDHHNVVRDKHNFALCGPPFAHSKSPLLSAQMLVQCGCYFSHPSAAPLG
jgi:hypothetical protein